MYPIHFITALLPIIVTFLNTPVNGLGVNCKGAFRCAFLINPDLLDRLILNFDLIDDGALYKNKAPISCLGGGLIGYFCAFTQGHMPSDGTTGSLLKQKIQELRNHGCRACGSVPLSANDPNVKGILTVNYVTTIGVCIQLGVCPPSSHIPDAPPIPLSISILPTPKPKPK